MKINVLLIISLFTISSSCQNSENNSSEIVDLRKEIHLIGAVKSIKHRTYDIEGRTSVKFEKRKKYCSSRMNHPFPFYTISDNYDITYNLRGQILNFIRFDNDGEETFMENSIIDKSGNILEYTSKYSKYDNKTTKEINEIGQNGKVKMTKIYNSQNELESYSKIEFNELQKPILKQEFDNNDVLIRKHIHQYLNRKTIITIYNKDGKLTDTFIYNDKDQIVEMINLIISSFYNDKNEIIKETSSEEKKNIEYNSEGAIVKFEIYNGGRNYKYTNKFDNKLNIISQIFVLSQVYMLGKTPLDKTIEVSWKYKFDNHGNWIERTEYVYHEPICVTKREINYY